MLQSARGSKNVLGREQIRQIDSIPMKPQALKVFQEIMVLSYWNLFSIKAE